MGEDIEVEDKGEGDIKVLTVHKAKGLEFDVVIIPDTVWPPQPENRLLLHHYLEGKIRPDKILWRNVGRLFPPIEQESKDRVIEDEKRLLYVALTRAIEGIYLIGFGGTRSVWFDLIKERFGCPYKIGEIEGRELRVESEEFKVESKELRVESEGVREERELYSPTERGVELITQKRRERMEIGDIVHKALSRLKWIDGKEITGLTEELLSYLRSVYVRREEDEWLIEEVKGIIYNTLIHPDFQFAFRKNNRDITVRVEVPVYFKEKKRDVSVRIDRLLIEPERITIIDYKTGEEKGDDIEQIVWYKKGMEKVFPERTIKAYLLYVEQGKVIEVGRK